jgi:putrescine---pyruvate transaminase
MDNNIHHNYAKEVWEKDRKHFIHPWTNFSSFDKDGSLVMNEAKGAYVTDIDGKVYLDGIGGLWCVNVGYGRDEIADAIADQARKMPYFNPFTDTTNVPAAELSAKLAELAPGDLNHVMFTGGGSTANDSAYRLIQYYQRDRGKPEKRNIIARKEAYHGSTYLTAGLSGKEMDKNPNFEFDYDDIHHISTPDPYRRPDGMTEEAFTISLVEEFDQKVQELGPDTVSAFWAEPIMGAGGVHVPPMNYFTGIKALCDKYDILFVADEVVTGFGRVGHWFCIKEMFGVQPDIIVCAKGLTSGYQALGAAIVSDGIYNSVAANPDNWFNNGFTYSGHPVACAAALKNIEIMERENLFDHVKDVGSYFMERLQTLRDVPHVGDVRGSHFMACIEYVADKETKELFGDEVHIGKLVANAAESRGLIVRPVGHLNVLSPCLILSKEECDTFVEILRDSMTEVLEKLKSGGVI